MRWAVSLAIAVLSASAVCAQDNSALVRTYCVGCHNQKLKSGAVALDTLDPARDVIVLQTDDSHPEFRQHSPHLQFDGRPATPVHSPPPAVV